MNNPIHVSAISNYYRLVNLCLLLAIAVVLTESISAQNFIENPMEIKEIPSSPTMWGFEKFGKYPVSMFTGVPAIEIPIYNIKSGEIEIPITLKYHASGI